jgi:inner membrane protein
VIALSLGIHIVGDWITAFGTMFLAPLSDHRFALSTTFIIDLWFTGIIVVGLVAAAVWRASNIPAVIGMATLAGYVAFQAVQQQRAINFGEAYARAQGLSTARVSAVPRPVSPFNWMVVVEDGDRIDFTQVNLSRTKPYVPPPDAGFIARLSAPYLPLGEARWTVAHRYGPEVTRGMVRAAWDSPELAFYRWFAAYPVFYRLDSGNPSSCVWFEDLRFVTPGRGTVPFRYGLCREGDGPWRPFELDGNARLAVY